VANLFFQTGSPQITQLFPCRVDSNELPETSLIQPTFLAHEIQLPICMALIFQAAKLEFTISVTVTFARIAYLLQYLCSNRL
jgi:hypothetical protein